MPYITNREPFSQGLNALAPMNSGELNYVISSVVSDYLYNTTNGSPKYVDFNEVIGVLECAKLELYRRMVAPYEDQKIAENGDVY